MVAIFTGLGAGLERGSGSLLGSLGLLGSGSFGRSGEQVSLNAATGNLVIQQQDAFLAGLGLDASIGRTYNARPDASDGDNGDNWQESTTRLVTVAAGFTYGAAGSTVSRQDADGSVITYSWNVSANAYVASDGAGAYDKLTQSGGSWTWTDGDSQATETYTAYGTNSWRITAQTDTDGNHLTFGYTGANLTSITTQNGESITLTWSGSQITQLATNFTDPVTGAHSQTTTRYGYDASGRLATVTVDLSPSDNSVADGNVYTTTYGYDASGRVNAITETDGSHLAIAYVATGAYAGRVQSITQSVASGVTRVTSLDYESGYTNVTDPSGQVTRLDYNTSDQLTRITLPPATSGATAQTLQFAYTPDGLGNVQSVTDANGGVTSYTYDAWGNVLTTTDPLGNVVTRTYDAKNGVLTETHMASDDSGAAVAQTTRYVYNSQHLVQFVISPSGDVTEYQYAANGELQYTFAYPEQRYDVSGLASNVAPTITQVNSWLTAIPDLSSRQDTGNTYDARGDLTSTISYGIATTTGGASTAQGYSETFYTYDQAGRLLSSHRQGQNATHYVYDGLGRLTASTDAAGNQTTIVFNDKASMTIMTLASGLVQTDIYDLAGDLIASNKATQAVSPNTNPDLSNAQQWSTANATAASVPAIAGQPAYQYTSVADGAAQVYSSAQTVAPGETVTFEVTLMGAGSTATDLVGLYGSTTGWGATNGATVTIFSGPGTLSQGSGAFWRVSGLSTTEATRVRITRTYTTSETARAYVYAGNSSAAVAGDTVIVSAPSIIARLSSSGNTASDLSTTQEWNVSNLMVAASAAIAGQPAYQYTTVADGAGKLFSNAQPVIADQTVVFEVTLMGVGTTTSDYLGLFGTAGASWGANAASTAVVESGPGMVTQSSGGLWNVTGLSTSQATRIRITRTYSAADTAQACVYAGSTSAAVAGNAVIVSAPALVAGAEAGVVAPYDADLGAAAQWTTANITTTAGIAINGQPAYNYAVTTSGASGQVVSGPQYAGAGETITFDVTVKGSGSTTTDALGLYGYVGGWGANEMSTAVVVSGPGTLAQDGGGLWRISGLSTAQETRIRITRTYATADVARAYIYAGSPGTAATAGSAIIVAAPSLVRSSALGLPEASVTSVYAHDSLGRLRVATDATGRSSYVLYNLAGEKTADIAADGAITEYRYDQGGRLIATVAYATTLTPTQLASLADPNTMPDIATIRPAASANDLWNWTVYDKDGRVTETIDGDGDVIAMSYDAAGQLIQTTSYHNQLTSAQLTTLKTTPPATQVLPVADAAHDVTTRSFYDKDGNLIGTLDGLGHVTRTVYDDAGQAVETIAYANATTAASPATATFQAILAGVAVSASADRTMHNVYDGQGLLRYTVDGLNHVTEHDYNAAGQATTTIAYDGVIAATSDYTFDAVQQAVTTAGLASAAGTRRSYAVYNAAGQVAYAIDPNGGVIAYKYDATGSVAKAVAYAPLVAVSSLPSLTTMDVWAAATAIATAAGNRTTRSYQDAEGQTIYTVDGEGYVTQFEYDAAGQVTRSYRYDAALALSDSDTIKTIATDLLGKSFADQTIVYDLDGRVTDTYDALGVRTHNVYLGTGELASTTVAYGTSDAVTTAYTYDGAGQVLSETDAYGLPEAATTRYTYDGLGNVTSTTDPDGFTSYYYYDKLGRQISMRDAESYVTETQYDTFGDVVATTRRANRATNTASVSTLPAYTADATNDATTYTYYDQLGRATTTRDAESYVTQTTYDTFGDITSVTRRANKATNTASATTLPTYTADPNNDATTQFTYDHNGNVLKTTDAEVDGSGNPVSESYTYDAFGDRLTVTNRLGAITTNSYDRRGLLVKEVLPISAVIGTGATEAASVTNTFAYDARGNRITMVEALGLTEQRTTSYAYDKLDRLILTTHNQIQWTDNFGTLTTASPTQAYAYDKRGNLIQQTDPVGFRTLYYYDGLNRKIATVDAVGDYTKLSYDADGNVLSSTAYGTQLNMGSDPLTGQYAVNAGGTPPAAPSGNSRTTTWSYDKLGRMLTTSIAGVETGAWNGTSYVTSTATITTSQQYDARGNVVSQTDADGHTVYTYYDRNSNKTGQVDQLGYRTDWTLDSDGNVLTETRYANAATSYSVTSKGTVTADTVNDRTTTFTYDRDGRRLTETRNAVIAWTINATSGTASGGTAIASTVNYTYNALGQVLTKREATGDTTTYAYDTSGRLTTVTAPAITDYTGTSTQAVTHDYYDGLGDLTRTTVTGTAGSPGTRVTSYTYNAGGQLTSTTDASGFTHNYAYGLNGNLVQDRYTRLKSDNTTQVTEAQITNYDALGRVVYQSVGTLSGTTWTFGDYTQTHYDAYGEMDKQGVNGLWQQNYAYDGAGRLLSATQDDGTTQLYLSDANGNRTLTVASSGTNLQGMSLTSAINLLTNNGANTIGAVAVSGVTATITVYDARNQATQTRYPFRDVAAGATQSLVTQTKFDAFGEVIETTDANGGVIDYTYNTEGKVITSQAPIASSTSANGTISPGRATQTNYYDLSGRLVGTVDANGNVNTQTLLAGTGYDGGTASTLKEFHADGGILERKYDVLGDMRTEINEIGQTESYTYDAMDRLIEQDHQARAPGSPGNSGSTTVQLIDHYSYDGLGQRTRHWNNEFGSGVVETTDYDAQGRVISMVDLGGATTTYGYTWVASRVNSGLGSATIGGWNEVTVNSAGKTETDQQDVFGHELAKTDYGSHTFAYTFDAAGRETKLTDSLGGETDTVWFNTGNIATVTDGTVSGGVFTAADVTTYKYDGNGNRTGEKYVIGGVTKEDATVTWDAMNRMASFTDAGDGNDANDTATISYEYDQNSNVRRVDATYHAVDGNGSFVSGTQNIDDWYTYDAMNRETITSGQLSATVSGTTVYGNDARGVGTIAVGGGTAITYDAAGNRHTVTNISDKLVWNGYALTNRSNGLIESYSDFNDVQTQPGTYWAAASVTYSGTEIETYSYTTDGYLAGVSISIQQASASGVGGGGNGYPAVTRFMSASLPRATYVLDAMGRSTDYKEYEANGSTVAYERADTYNNRGDILSETVTSVVMFAAPDGSRRPGTYVSTTTNDYGAQNGTLWNGAYQGGVVTHSQTTTTLDGTAQPTTSTVNGYTWWDSAQQTSITFTPNTGSPGTVNTTTYTYNALDHLQSIRVADGHPRTILFTSDATGQILNRDENYDDGASAPRAKYYYFDGIRVGDVSNDGTSDTNYADAITAHQTARGNGAFTNGAISFGGSYENFDQSYDPLNGLDYAGAPTTYTVQSGDTLPAIAQQLWGDASLWYKLADANGLDGSEALVAGQDLTVPTNVVGTHNTSSTYRVYDPNDAIGNVSPIAPKPQVAQKHGCGAFGAILLAVVAIAVATIATAGVASLATGATFGDSLGAVLGGTLGSLGAVGGVGGLGTAGAIGVSAVGGAIGSVVSQGIGVATGLQSQFDWAGVALAGIAGGIGGAGSIGNVAGSKFLGRVATGALDDGLTQGIGVATGLQSSFDWAGVAGAGIGAGIGGEVHLNAGSGVIANAASRFASSAASGLANAATRSLIDGTDFGDNILAALPDTIAQTIGGLFQNQAKGDLVDQLFGNADLATTPASIADLATPPSGYNPADATNQPAPGIVSGATATPTPTQGGGQVGGSTSSDVNDGGVGPDIVVTASSGSSGPPAIGAYPGGTFDPSSTWSQWVRDQAGDRNAATDLGAWYKGFGKSIGETYLASDTAFASTASQLVASLQNDPFGQNIAINLFGPASADPVYGAQFSALTSDIQGLQDAATARADAAELELGEGLASSQYKIAQMVFPEVALADLGWRAVNGEKLTAADALTVLPVLGKFAEAGRVASVGAESDWTRAAANAQGPYIELGSPEAIASKRVYYEALNSQEPLVIGRLEDTATGAQLGMRRLNDPDWTINVNDAWINGGIDAQKPFYLGSNISIENLRSGNALFPKTVFMRELQQLRGAGYYRQGDLMLPPQSH